MLFKEFEYIPFSSKLFHHSINKRMDFKRILSQRLWTGWVKISWKKIVNIIKISKISRRLKIEWLHSKTMLMQKSKNQYVLVKYINYTKPEYIRGINWYKYKIQTSIISRNKLWNSKSKSDESRVLMNFWSISLLSLLFEFLAK